MSERDHDHHGPNRAEPETTAAGRPKDSGHRQQTGSHQTTQSGARELDEHSSRERTPPVPAEPPGAK